MNWPHDALLSTKLVLTSPNICGWSACIVSLITKNHRVCFVCCLFVSLFGYYLLSCYNLNNKSLLSEDYWTQCRAVLRDIIWVLKSDSSAAKSAYRRIPEVKRLVFLAQITNETFMTSTETSWLLKSVHFQLSFCLINKCHVFFVLPSFIIFFPLLLLFPCVYASVPSVNAEALLRVLGVAYCLWQTYG
jgi:hypothetical protein